MPIEKVANLNLDLTWGLLNTPFKIPMTPHQRYLTLKAKAAFRSLKTGEKLIHGPRDYRCYFFSPKKPVKRVFVLHGWISRAEHMMNIIRDLYHQNIEVVAIDLPAHGKSPGLQLGWKDTVKIILDVQERYGKFDFAVGHSYGGAMLLTSLGISNLGFDEFEKDLILPKLILLGSPTKVDTPVRLLSKITRLNEGQKHKIYQRIISHDQVAPEHLDGVYLQKNYPTKTEFLCIHSINDKVIPHSDAIHLKQLGDRVQLITKEKLGHLKILNNQSVLDDIRQFIH
jgi:hypothetical protein